MFYLGGGTLRSLDAQQLQGTGRTLAHADFIVLDPLQIAAGHQPRADVPGAGGRLRGRGLGVGSSTRSTGIAPRQPDATCRTGATGSLRPGVSLLYRPGLPDPDSFVRLDWVVPIGADGRSSRLYLSFMRALNFLHQK